MKYIITHKEEIDLDPIHHSVSYLDDLAQVTGKEQVILLHPQAVEDLKQVNNFFLPYSKENYMRVSEHTQGRVYFPLECYSFFQQIKEEMLNTKEGMGVLRFRRHCRKDSLIDLATGDLFVLSRLLGKEERISIKQSPAHLAPRHVILLIRYEGSKLAHIEYSESGEDRIEFEWSHPEKIIEFDSYERKPFFSKDSNYPLVARPSAILQNARPASDPLDQGLAFYEKILGEGEKR